MSCNIGTGSGSKAVNDIKVGISTSATKDVSVVKRWDGTILWQRKAKTKELTAANTRFTIDPTGYSWSDSSGYHIYTNCHPVPYSVQYYLQSNTIDYNNGSEWITLTQGTHFKVTYSSNTDSGRLPSSGTTTGTYSVTGEMYIEGLESGGYSGKITKTFTIKYSYASPTVYYYYVSFDGNGGSGSMSNQTIQRDVATALTENGFSAPDTSKTFKGWSSSASGSVEYTNKQKVTNLAAANATKQLYAVWGSKPAMVSIAILKTSHYAANNAISKTYTVYGSSFIGGDFSITFDDGTTITPSYSGEYGITWSTSKGVNYYDVTYYDGEAIASSKLPAYVSTLNLNVTSDGTTYASGTCKNNDYWAMTYSG